VVEDKPEVKKAGGVYYTPTYIVDYIVEHTVGRLLDGLTAKQAASLRILDPACGSGSFLIGAYQYLLDWHLRAYAEHPEKHRKELHQGRAGEWQLTTAEKKRILLANIYGVDIDVQAVETTKLSLLLKVLEGETSATIESQLSFLHERALPDLAANIKCGNSLIGPDFYDDQQLGLGILDEEERYRINVFDWEAEFPEILGNGVRDERRGFDAVIGNPPYRMIQPHNTKDESLGYLRVRYPQTEFKLDLYQLFLLRGVALLHNGAFLGYIVPTPLLNNVYAESLRQALMDDCSIEMLSVAKGRVFANADVHTMVVVLRRECDENARASHQLLATSGLDERANDGRLEYSTTAQSRYAQTRGHVWNILLTEENASVLERLAATGCALGDVSTMNRGLITGARGEFFSSERRDERDVPIIGGADVHRYYTKEPTEYVRFERPDSAGGCWLPEVHFAPHKIIMRQIGSAPTASLVVEPLAVTGNVFTIRCADVQEEKFTLGVLNSRLMAFFWRTMFADFKTSFPQFTIFSLTQAPLPQWRSADAACAALVECVEGMLSTRKRALVVHTGHDRIVLEREITRLDYLIDRLVFELYGLTDSEIALVEGQID